MPAHSTVFTVANGTAPRISVPVGAWFSELPKAYRFAALLITSS